jgi:UDP-2,3-diacylglucosamine hydrolase
MRRLSQDRTTSRRHYQSPTKQQPTSQPVATRITSLENKKIYFASDFHLGVPDHASSMQREKSIVQWLDSIKHDAHSIYLLGDIFDFWFEYKYTIPKGYIRLLGKLAELRDAGIPIVFFTGNHDMWMFDYFPKELGIPVFRKPTLLEVGDHKLLIGHGDGLGPGDRSYKVLKKFFNSNVCQWLFARIHPNLGIAIANAWSRKSRITNNMREEKFEGQEREFLWIYCNELQKTRHHDYYIFGHRHLPLNLQVADNSTYINLGEWVHFKTYAVYDGTNVELKEFKPETR